MADLKNTIVNGNVSLTSGNILFSEGTPQHIIYNRDNPVPPYLTSYLTYIGCGKKDIFIEQYNTTSIKRYIGNNDIAIVSKNDSNDQENNEFYYSCYLNSDYRKPFKVIFRRVDIRLGSANKVVLSTKPIGSGIIVATRTNISGSSIGDNVFTIPFSCTSTSFNTQTGFSSSAASNIQFVCESNSTNLYVYLPLVSNYGGYYNIAIFYTDY